MIMKLHFLTCWALLLAVAQAEVAVSIDRNAPAEATPAFRFSKVPAPAKSDAAAAATFAILDGEPDRNGAGLEALHDGRLPGDEDQPARNFFFGRSAGGRLLVDLGAPIEIKRVTSYSWHSDSRAPQVYDLYASDGNTAGFQARPTRPLDPATVGWNLIARVDTRPKQGPVGGQYGVSISDTGGSLGTYRFLLLEIACTETADPFGNTFYSEFDVIDAKAPAAPPVVAQVQTYEIEGGKWQFVMDTTDTPDLTPWARQELAPVIQKWYPLIAAMLPSEGYEAPSRFSVTFPADQTGVAVTTGSRILGAPEWYRKNLHGEGLGSIVHELVHVVQHYGKGKRPPGWLIEGIPDYIRFYLYEPESHGADIPPQRAASARYDASYRTTANFLHWVIGKYDQDLIRKLNAAMREGTYDDSIWKTLTGHTAPELAEEWKQALSAAKAG